MSPHSLTNFEIQKYYQNKPRFNGAYSRDNLPKKINYFKTCWRIVIAATMKNKLSVLILVVWS